MTLTFINVISVTNILVYSALIGTQKLTKEYVKPFFFFFLLIAKASGQINEFNTILLL